MVYRPSHIHYKASYQNENEITTQLYFEGDSSIETDPWASDISAENRIVQIEEDEQNNLHAIFDIFLNVNADDLEQTHLNEEKIIKSIFPNPINETTKIDLNTKNSSITIDICDINGKVLVCQKNITNNTIILSEILKEKLPKGMYILRILKNNNTTDVKRFVVN